MKKVTSYGVCLGLAGAMLLVSTSPVLAASATQMKACKNAVAGKQKFHDIPMAGISVRPGKGDNKVAFTVQWDGANGHGNCKVSPDGNVREVNVKSFHSGGGSNESGSTHRDSGGYVEQDGFWRDKSGRWIDPDGEVCHSCTPENGFPAATHRHSGASSKEIDGFYYDSHTGQWRDPNGEVCHSCTPENGFPDQ